MRIVPIMQLRCGDCGIGMPDDTAVEAFQLHMQVEHDKDEVQLDLLPVCTCGEVMEETGDSVLGGGATRIWLRCPVCGSTGSITQRGTT